MANWKAKLRRWLIRWKTRRWTGQAEALSFPVPAQMVQKVLVILPRELQALDAAQQFVFQLRNKFPQWQIEIFDVDKIPPAELSFWGLPSDPLMEKLRSAGYQLILNLSATRDVVDDYLVLASGATFRVGLYRQADRFYNITCLPRQQGEATSYQGVLTALEQLFVRSAA